MAQAQLAVAPPALAVAAPQNNKWAVAIAVAIGALLEVIDTSIVNVGLADMQTSLGASLSQASWIVSSYAVANVIILPLAAWLGHRFGKKKYFIFSLVGFTVASLLCGLSTSLPMLVIARVLQGITGGGLMAKAQSILFETFPKEEQATAQSFFGAIVIAGPAIGPTLGGYIVTNIGWRWIFFINLPLGVLAVLLCLSALPPDEPHKTPPKGIDWASIAMLAIGLGCLQTFLEEGNSHDWFDDPMIVVLCVASIVSLVLFVRRALASDEPVVDLRVLRYRSLWAGSILSVVVGMALYGGLFAVPIFAQTNLRYTSQQTGLMMLPGALATAAMMQVAGRLARKMDPRLMLVIGALILAGSLAMFSTMNPMTSGDDLFWPLIVRSLGTVFMFLPLSMASLGPIPRKDVASATGFFNLTRMLGGSVGVALLSMMLTRRQAFHAAVVAEKLVSNDPATIERVNMLTGAMMAKGASAVEAKQRALSLLSGTVAQQGSIMSFADTFWLAGMLIVLFLPLVMLLGKPQQGVKVDAGH
ncbi:DHA2 family efflux MFS transporter permease subunit [Polyangium mundeleinium]|uniref:DHA2 family efflux MFS transporter permease subunit n=1 Tax=Polyangium mundeleinium TaxID=2995306 RepID=A0ABT5F476_9BACT|nr:DHA2 family efflux MFS transporter permease subunit [Polyangium mundeleinium]MDC0747942.1 DHA2 family efflux MFS transporter permease subunit [Polyangium mundeleinium]